MRVEDWLPRFLTDHIKRFPGITWPPLGTDPFIELAKVWRYNLVKSGITPEVAQEASYSLAGIEHYQADHLPKFLQLCREIFQRAAGQTTTASGHTLKEATRLSADCRDCDGGGWTRRFIWPEFHGEFLTATGEPVEIGTGIALPCGCPLGRLIARSDDRRSVADDPTLRIGPLDWSDQPDNAYRYHPCEPTHFPAGRNGVSVLQTMIDRIEAERGPLPQAGPIGATLDQVLGADPPPPPSPPPVGPDPVIDRERQARERQARERAAAAVAAPKPIHIPEDDIDGWF